MEFNRSNLIVRLKSIDFGNRLKCRNECDLVLPVSRVCTECWILEIKKSCNFPGLEIVWKVGIIKVLSFFFQSCNKCFLSEILGVRLQSILKKALFLHFLRSVWGGVYMRKLALVRVSYQDDFLISYRVTWWLGHFISLYLKVHFMLIK